MSVIIGIDHGNDNMKTAHTCFPCGFKMQETEPDKLFANDVIEYNGKYYVLTTDRFPYSTDKTLTDNAYILTLFSIAKEIISRRKENQKDFNFKNDFNGFIGKEVVLGVGLPPAHFEKQKTAFKEYFLRNSAHGVKFKYNGKPFNFYVKDVIVYPQNLAAILTSKADLIKEYSTIYCIDIGGGTTDLIGLTNGVPDKNSIFSREVGMSKLRNQIINDVINDYGRTLDAKDIEAYQNGKKLGLAPDEADLIYKRIDKATMDYTNDLINLLHTKIPDFKTVPVVFCGGGAKILKPYILSTGQFGTVDFIEEIGANAIGYEQMSKAIVK